MRADVADEEWVSGTVTSAAALERPAGAWAGRLPRLSDERLARLVATADERAIAALYERYHQLLYRYCRSILIEDCDAQDAVQSTFVSAISALRRSQRNAPLRPWLFRIAHNESISLIRRRRNSSQELAEEHTRPVASAEDAAADRARLALLVADLSELPERLRSALCMRELSGLSHEEIAVALEVSVGGAKQAIFEARRAMAEFTEGRAMTCDEVCRRMSEGDRRALRGRKVRAHLRDCAGCAAFAAAIPSRRADLRAIAPVLPPAASAALFGRTIGALSGHTGHGGAGLAGGAATAGGWSAPATIGAAGKTLGATLASKTALSAALLATAVAGAGGVTAVVALESPARHPPPAPVAQPAREHGVAESGSNAAVSAAAIHRRNVGANSHGKAVSSIAKTLGATQRAAHANAAHPFGHAVAARHTAASHRRVHSSSVTRTGSRPSSTGTLHRVTPVLRAPPPLPGPPSSTVRESTTHLAHQPALQTPPTAAP